MDSSVSFSGELDIRIGFRYILALAVSATSSTSGWADNCQSVIALGDMVFGFSIYGNTYLFP